MEAKEFQTFVGSLGKLTKERHDAILEAIHGRASAMSAVALIDARFALAPECGHCRSKTIRPWSKPNPIRRYMCDACGKTFTALTGTPLQNLRRRDAWLEYAQCLADGTTLRKAASRCKIRQTERGNVKSGRRGQLRGLINKPGFNPRSPRFFLNDFSDMTRDIRWHRAFERSMCRQQNVGPRCVLIRDCFGHHRCRQIM